MGYIAIKLLSLKSKISIMEADFLIRKIELHHRLEDVFSSDFISSYRKAISLLHPDVCHLRGASKAFIKLNKLKEDFDRKNKFEDDAGRVEFDDFQALFKGEQTLLELSYDNYNVLKNQTNEAAHSFLHYLPDSMGVSHELKVGFLHRSVPVGRLVLPQKHVLWILSRILEFNAWMSQIGFVHGGIHPHTLFIVPETHGIIIPTFYHMTVKGRKMKTLSAKYKHWYPTQLFTDKMARTSIDLKLSKRTAAFLLGDPSGMGIVLRKSHHPALISFLLKKHSDAYECYDEYRQMLKNNFKREFHVLDI